MSWFGWLGAIFMIALGLTLLYKPEKRVEVFWGFMLIFTAVMLVMNSFYKFMR